MGLEVEQRGGEGGLQVSRWRNRETFTPRRAPAAHRGFEISWVHRGQVEYVVGQRHLCLGSGDAIVVPEGVEHDTRILPGTLAMSIKIDATPFHEALDDERAFFDPVVQRREACVDRLGGALWCLLDPASVAGRRAKVVVPERLAQHIVRRLLRRHSFVDAPVTDGRVKRAVELVEAHLAESIDVDDMARAAGMSRFHFARSFRRATGASPYQWLIQRRVERAALLLRDGRVTVTEAAMEVGFSDLGRFSRAFRAQLGCPPSTFVRDDSWL